MQKSKIEWCDYSINPIKGYCPHDCPYCYSHRMYNRFGWDRKLRFDESVFKGLKTIKEPSRIFVGSMIDLNHPAVISWSPFCLDKIVHECELFPQHTFITLTKFPRNINGYSFPKNWWIGTTIDGNYRYTKYPPPLSNFTGKNKIFVSFEPILDASVTLVEIKWYDWIIIGGKFPGPVHKKEWIDDILRRADDLNIPVFIKKNAHYPIECKEFPV